MAFKGDGPDQMTKALRVAQVPAWSEFTKDIPLEKPADWRDHEPTPTEDGSSHVYCEVCGLSCCDEGYFDKPCVGFFDFEKLCQPSAPSSA